ncbi:HEXXH motif domain-containing protein [Streptomyces sp. NPDC006372]|uniref:HEXXH motif domain-containing protein n=1 Tax=Streptomyces sp. NPDC006372 TaxID=3155599 RepID=UPI0033BB77BE
MIERLGVCTHGLQRADLDRLAQGVNDVATVERLCEAERSKHILLFHSVISEAARRFPALHAGLELAGVWEALGRVQREAPEVLGRVFQMPQLGAWAVDCLRSVTQADQASPALRADLAQAGTFAAAGCIWAGIDFDLPLVVPDGRLVLPGLGALPVSVQGDVRLRRRSARLEIMVGGVPSPLPEPVPVRVCVRDRNVSFSVDLDDTTPYLDRYRHRRTERLSSLDLQRWSERIAGAWRILTEHHPDTAAAMSVAVQTIVPLRPDLKGSTVAATSPAVFGAIATSLAADDLTLAETLVHEFQHLKLCGILDLFPLVVPGDGALSYAPWRDDPRPVRGLLQGAYAYLGVTRFWQVQRWHMPPDRALRGHAEFFRRCRETLEVVMGLLVSGRLTAEGRRFVEVAAQQLRRWQRDCVPDTASRLALAASCEHRTTWEARHVSFDPEPVVRLAEAWNAGRTREPAECASMQRRVQPAHQRPAHARGTLLTMRYADPERFRELLEEKGPGGPGGLRLSAADVALLRDDMPSATAAYRAEICRRPVEPEVWSGLSMAAADSMPGPAAAFLRRRVALVFAVHSAIHDITGSRIDPLELAGWLADAEVTECSS